MGKKQNAGKQERRDKKEKKAKAEAEAIISAAKDKARSRATLPFADERKEGCTDEDFEIGVRVRQLRDEGMPWWAIARDLELEGAGQSATTGKKGAARARVAYTKAFGAFPRTFRSGGYKGPVETNENVKAIKAQKRSELKARAAKGKAVIKKSVPDEELAGMLKGRTIKWMIINEHLSEPMEMQAHIHPKTPFYVYDSPDGDRCIEFRERDPRAPNTYRMVPGQTRTVRVKRIFYIK